MAEQQVLSMEPLRSCPPEQGPWEGGPGLAKNHRVQGPRLGFPKGEGEGGGDQGAAPSSGWSKLRSSSTHLECFWDG